jgi:hypothetical protein
VKVEVESSVDQGQAETRGNPKVALDQKEGTTRERLDAAGQSSAEYPSDEQVKG